MSESITGYIDHIIFRNEDNGYTVMVLKGVSEEDELTCVGSFPVVTQGASVELEGNFTQHPVYGKQFQAVRLTEKMPEDALAMERYLGSGAIKGIGAALAGRIVRHFGDDTFQIVENEPERLSEVKGISEKKAREIAMQIAEKSDMRKAMMFLQKYGISLNLGAKIYQKYGDSVYSVLQENPYRLADDISGVGFKIADEIAYRIGIHTDSDYRIKSGMVYTLLQATGEGHVYLPKDELFQRAAELLGVDSSYMEKHLVDLAMDRKIVQKEQGDQILIYPATYNDYTENSPFPSVKENGTDYLLTAGKMQDYIDLYARNKEDKKNPYFAPYIAEDLANQPDTLILTCEFDPLRDEGEAYGKRLKEAGNYVEIHRIKDALHGYFALGIKQLHVQESFTYINEFLKEETL